MTICQLIRQRQQELMARLEAMERAAQQDNGGALPHTDLNALNDEMNFLVALGSERLRELSQQYLPDEPRR